MNIRQILHVPAVARTARGAALAFCAALPLLPLYPFVRWPATFDHVRYLIHVEQFRSTFLAGFLYPRWLPDLFGNFGYPLFCFYQPGFFFLYLPFTFIPGYPTSSAYAVQFCLFLAGAAGIYCIGRSVANRITGIFTALLFILTPYLYVNFYVRGDLSELAAMMILPWPIFFLLEIHRKAGGDPLFGSTVGCIITLGLVVICHPAVGLFAYPLWCCLAGALTFSAVDRRRFAVSATCVAACVLLITCPYWMPVFSLMSEASISNLTIGYYRAEYHTVEFHQFFDRTWGFGMSLPSDDDELSFQLGLPHFLLALGGAVAGRRHRFIQIAFGAYVLLILLMSPAGIPLWRSVGLMQKVQFPWRLLGLTATLQAICAMGLGRLVVVGRMRHLAVPACLLVVVGCTHWYKDQFRTEMFIEPDREVSFWNSHYRYQHFTSFTSQDEYTPATLKDSGLLEIRSPTSPILEITGAAYSLPTTQSSLHRIQTHIYNRSPAVVKLNQLYFPGWRVTLDGEHLTDREIFDPAYDDGLMRIAITDEGAHLLSAWYAGPPGGAYRAVLAWLGVVLILIFGGWERSHRTKKWPTGRVAAGAFVAALVCALLNTTPLPHPSPPDIGSTPSLDDGSAMHSESLVQKGAGRTRKAIGLIRSALAKEPQNPRYLSHLGILYMAEGEVETALSLFRYLVDAHPGNTDHRVNLIAGLVNTGAHDEAIDQCRALLQANPRNARGHALEAIAWLRTGHRDSARAAASRARLVDTSGGPVLKPELQSIAEELERLDQLD